MIVNGFFPIGEIPFQEGTNDASANGGDAQGDNFSVVLFLILAAPAAKSSQVTCDLEPSLPAVTSDGGSSAGSVLSQSSGSCEANQDVIEAPVMPANPEAVGRAQEFTGEQKASMIIPSADASHTQFASGAAIALGSRVDLDPTRETWPSRDQRTGSRGESNGSACASEAQLAKTMQLEPEPIFHDVVITPSAQRPGDGAARNAIAANVTRDLLPWSVDPMVGQNANGQPNGATDTVPKDLISRNGIRKTETVSVVTPLVQFPDHALQFIALQPKDVRVVLHTATVTFESNPLSADARVADQNAPRQPQGFSVDDSVWVKDSIDDADFAVAREQMAPGDEVPRLGRQLQAQVKSDPHGRTLWETIHSIGETGSPDARRGHSGRQQQGVSAPFSEPLQAPDEFAQHGGAPYNATNLTDKTATAAVREMEPARWRPLVEQVAGEINGHIRIGKQEAIMQLDPPELGKLRIDLHLDGDRLEARILAETPESRALIETHLPELRRILGENRVELVDVRIDSGSWSSAGGDGHGWPRQEANGGYQPTNDFGGVLGVGAEEREPERRQPEAHEPGRVSMWA